jgi:FecR protein
MRKNFKFLVSTLGLLLIAVLLSSTGTAQHLISSKAGFVNRTDGKVYIQREDIEEGQRGPASLGTQMRNGDRISTESESFAEILLNPGSYLRLNQSSAVRALDTSLAQVRFELIEGSMIVEVGEVNKKTPIEMVTRHGSFFITKDGLHRIDTREGMTSIAVRQGDVLLGTREDVLAQKAFKIKRGKVAQLTGTPQPVLTKLDQDKVDSFDVWSFQRAETLMVANMRSLQQSRQTTSLAYGWLYDPFYRCYTFIPRGGLFFSPYGFGFFNSYGDCFTCGYWPYGGYRYGGGYRPGRNNTGGTGDNNPPARVVAGVDRAPIRREVEGRRIESSGSVFDSSSRDNFPSGSRSGSSRGVSPPSSSPSVTSSPSPTRNSGRSSGDGGGRSMPSRPRN